MSSDPEFGAVGAVSVGAVSVSSVLRALDLNACGADAFTGHSLRIGLPRVFGGQLLAQSLVAAARTVPRRAAAHSLHLYFLRPGDHDAPITFHVERVRDGRRLSVRTVRAVQDDRVISTMATSFHDVPADPPTARQIVPEHQAPSPSVHDPARLPTLAQHARQWGGLGEIWSCRQAMECRVDPAAPDHAWLRLNETVPDDPTLHQALLAYLSDVTIMAAVMARHGVPMGAERLDPSWDGVSLDHAIWFHRPARADQWLLFAQDSPSAADGRALARAGVYTADGRLAASIAQEGLFFGLPG